MRDTVIDDDHAIIWMGTAPSRAVREALAARGIGIATAPPASGTDAIALDEPGLRSDRLRARRCGGLRAERRGDADGADAAPLDLGDAAAGARRRAPRGGARAAPTTCIALDATEAIAQLVARVEELLVDGDPPIPDRPGTAWSRRARRRGASLAQAARVAPTSMPVLLTGETGTGKEVVARLIHAWSPRRAKQFVPINCAAIPNELMEAELFGYARGAFSGAVQRYDGQLMAAEGGTVFLDEIDDTPLATQVKLLRVLEDRVVSRLGENVWHQVDFRIIAATNRDLLPLIAVAARSAAISTSGSRSSRSICCRCASGPRICRRWRATSSPASRASSRRPAPRACRASAPMRCARWTAYSWPGNIRELRNVLYETLVYKRAGEEILLSDLPTRILTRGERRRSTRRRSMRAPSPIASRAAASISAEEIAALERIALAEALARAGRQRRARRAAARARRPRPLVRSRRHGPRDDAPAGRSASRP